MKLRLPLFLAVLWLGVSPVCGIDVAKELALFQGVWELVELESNGKRIDEVAKLGCAMTIKGDQFTLRQGTQDITGVITINPNKQPKQVDALARDSQGNQQKSFGIYEFDKDKLKLCFVLEGKDRPSDFKTKEGSDTILEIFRKKK